MSERATVGLLYPGEMGTSLGRLLSAQGMRVVTTLEGRGELSAARAREAGLCVLPSLPDVVRASQYVVSLVHPSAAAQVAQSYARLRALAPAAVVYIDGNSIGPDLVRHIGSQLADAGIDFIDAAINGLAKNLSSGATLYLSGPRADEVSGIFASVVRVRVLGPDIGKASAMKMLLGGLSKGVCALYLELALLAGRHDMLPGMIEAVTTIYPGIQALVDRMLPTYARHAERRATEMGELELTARNAGIEPCVIAAIRELHEQLGTTEFGESDGDSVTALIKRVTAAGLLQAERADVV